MAKNKTEIHVTTVFDGELDATDVFVSLISQKYGKTNANNLNLAMVTIYTFLLFFCCFGCYKGEKPGNKGFSRQPARQRDSNRGCNGRSFSEWKLHLFCDLHKTVHRFFRRVAGVRCRVFTLPALLSAIFGKHSWVREVPPARNALVHNLVDFPDFPLLRLVKSMVQGFLIELLPEPISGRCGQKRWRFIKAAGSSWLSAPPCSGISKNTSGILCRRTPKPG